MEQQRVPLGEYNFPGPQYMHMVPPPPAPYMAPEQFYGHLMPFSTPQQSPDSPAPYGRKRASSDSSVDVPAVEELLPRRGRPRGSKNKAKTPTTTKAKAPKPKPTAKPAKKKSKKADQNTAPVAIELSDSDDDTEKTKDGKVRHWTADERTLFYQFLLAFDEEGEKRFEQHKKNPGHVYKRASELVFKGSRSAPSIKSMYTRSIDTFTWMLAFDSFTGNGGGDPDSDDPTAIQKRLTAARKAGLNLGSLKPATITEWDDNGWYDLFNDRLGTSAKISREVVRNSASALSDAEDNLDDYGADSDANINPVLLAQSRTAASHPAPPKTPAATVTEPKHTPSSAYRKQTSNSFGAIGDFMKMKMVSEEKRTHALDAKLQLEQEKLELDKAKVKVDMARNVFQMEGASDQVKDAANAYLLSIFS
ncbi:hypothetical protein C8R43DRAFT_1134917 [Mycena crocata]|nr:hypothetical protein C8R43DRAFT_1134917 [Mycena crocata]